MAQLRDGVIRRGKTWSYVIRVANPETGQSRPVWVGGFSSEAAAKAARDEARVLARRGEYVDRSKVTVGEYLDEWLDAHAVEVKPKTLSGYRDLVARYVQPRLGSMRLQAVRPATLTRLYRELLASGGRDGRPLSPRTVDFVHAILRKAFNDAVRVEQLLPSNPAERAKKPRRELRASGTIWTAGQLRAFLEEASGHRLAAFYRLAAYTGARRGELLNLRWSDVDLDAAQITIRGTYAVIDGNRVEGTTKGGRERTVSLDAGTVAALRSHRSEQAADRLAAESDWQGGDRVFTTGFGAPLHPDVVSQAMRRLIRNRDKREDVEPLPHARLHDLRHVHATMLLTAGVPVHVVAERLGHADPSITLRVYAHVIRQDASHVADLFASVLDTSPGPVPGGA